MAAAAAAGPLRALRFEFRTVKKKKRRRACLGVNQSAAAAAFLPSKPTSYFSLPRIIEPVGNAAGGLKLPTCRNKIVLGLAFKPFSLKAIDEPAAPF